MLAQNFKTAADLGIKEVEFDALQTVLGMLERGELIYGKTPLAKQFRLPNEFNMAVVLDESDCGSIGCLCGWAHIVSGRQAFAELIGRSWENEYEVIQAVPANLRRLFRFGAIAGSLYDIKPEQAAVALRSFLTTGEPRWSEAVA